jgi:hypothetical protein
MFKINFSKEREGYKKSRRKFKMEIILVPYSSYGLELQQVVCPIVYKLHYL